MGDDLLAAQRRGVVVERVAGEVEADRLALLGEPVHRRPVVGLRQPRRGQGVGGLAEEADLGRGALVVRGGREGRQRLQALEDLAAVRVEPVERAGAGQHLQRALAEAAQVDAGGEVEEAVEAAAGGAGVGDQPHRLDADVLQRAEGVDDAALADAEGRLGAVDARRHHRDAEAVDLLLVGAELVGQVEVAVHHRGHELDRVVGLEPGGLVADHGVGGGVRLVEAVVGELVEQVPDLVGLGAADAVGLGALDEQRLLRVHLGLDLLAHRAAQEVGAAEGEARELAGDLHHLLLVDDDALGLVEDRVDRGVQAVALLAAVLDVAELRDVLHRAGAVERDQRDDVLDARSA